VVLDVITVWEQFSVPHKLTKFFHSEFSKAPVFGGVDLLSAGELHFGPSERFESVGFVGFFAPDGHERVADFDSGDEAVGFTISTSHTSLEPISTSAGQHFINPSNVIRMSSNPQMKRLFTALFAIYLLAEILAASRASEPICSSSSETITIWIGKDMTSALLLPKS